jgi:hypothetical protein
MVNRLFINSWLRLHHQKIFHSSSKLPLYHETIESAEQVYRLSGYAYPRFFKMDLLCKWAWLSSELLLSANDGMRYDGLLPESIAVVLQTSHGCLTVDKQYLLTVSDIPSPSLFVYTLPSVMLGEICIRHGFKGEQLCSLAAAPDFTSLQVYVSDLLTNRGMHACLCGWIDVQEEHQDISLFWVIREEKGAPFSAQTLQGIYRGEV